MFNQRDLIREFNPYHPALDATVSKVDCKPLNGTSALVFVFLFSSDGSRLFIALGGAWDQATIDTAESLLGMKVKLALANRKRTSLELTVLPKDAKTGKEEGTRFQLNGIVSYCISCPETRRIDNVQPISDDQ